ncbi:MAG: M48 family metalloprotease [Nonomuraea sp.]|nr:M48 family metalloprotease [Nonomuraea sp.]NUP66854.1 M48 family metalloprotease [Nonomuraea sp.]
MSRSMKQWSARRQAAVVRDLHRDVVTAARSGAASRAGGSAGSARVVGYLVAWLIHLLPPALVAAGVFLLTRFTILSVPAGLVALDLAWVLRPRFGRISPADEKLTRQDAPRLFALIDRIGAETGAPRTDLVVISGEVNASFGTYGPRRRRVVEIGYPLWLVLTPEERVVVLAHEMAHASNGDARHGLVVGGALHSLTELREVSRFCWRPGDGISQLFAEGLLSLLGLPVRGLIVVLELLSYRSSQRAEYRADAIGARVGGTGAALSAMDAMSTRVVWARRFLATQTLAAGRQDLWEDLRTSVAGVPGSELDRLRADAEREELRVDRTHPPTHLRVEHLAALPYTEALVRPEAMEAVDDEIGQVAARVARGLRENAQAALYR